MQRALFLGWALVAVVVCLRLDPWQRPIVADNQLYFYLAERAASGTAPHVSHVDTKSQLGVLATAAAIRTGRALGADDVLASRTISIAAFALALPLAASLGAVLTGSTLAGHATAAALLGARALAEHAASGNNVKVFLLVFALLAHWAMARGGGLRESKEGAGRYDALAGAAAAAAFLCWQPALLVVAAVVFESLAARGGSLRRAATVLAGAVTMVAGYELYFVAHSALQEQWLQEYVMTLGSVHTPRRLAASLAFLMHEGRGATASVRLLPVSFALVTLAALVRLAMAPRAFLQSVRTRPGWMSCGLAGAGAVAFTIYDHQGIPDLFFPDPYFALSAGVVVAALVSASRRRWGERGRWVAVCAMATLLVATFVGTPPRHPRPGFNLEDQRELAGLLHGEHERGVSVWVYGAVHLLGLAHMDNHVAYGLFYDDVQSVLDVDSYRPLRDGEMPSVIVLPRRGIPGASDYLMAEYADRTPPAFAEQGWRMLRKRPG